MKELNPYLIFDGDCREAMTFYGRVFGAPPEIMYFKDAPIPEEMKKQGDRVIHAYLRKGNVVLMASDGRPGEAVRKGDNLRINIVCESREEVDRLFAALGEGGKPLMPPAEMFWGAYFGMLTDRYGTGWMFNFDLGKKPN
jgi:PhnB protein